MGSETPSFPCRLLVDLPNWLGDLMMALPAADRLVRANRGGTTILHARPSTVRLLGALYPYASVIATPRRSSALKVARSITSGGGRVDVGVTMRNAARAKITNRAQIEQLQPLQWCLLEGHLQLLRTQQMVTRLLRPRLRPPDNLFPHPRLEI